jgi:thiol-disulfide isomerase/thioredoxin
LGEEQRNFQNFKGSFFFCDGNYRLLTALTGETRIPSLVIIDPLSQQHYVFTKHTNLSYSSLEDFLHGFINGNLVPYQRSESEPESPREETRPPFVNMDFHEADSISQVTAHTFSEQVLGFNQSDNDFAANAWNEDVLVLFSNSWCGFCQRMELIVREVHRAIKGYINMLKTGSRTGETVLTDGKCTLKYIGLVHV